MHSSLFRLSLLAFAATTVACSSSSSPPAADDAAAANDSAAETSVANDDTGTSTNDASTNDTGVATPDAGSDEGTTPIEAGPPQTCGDGGVAPPTPSGTWKNVTHNLAGMASECGNLAFISSDPARDFVIAGIAQDGLWGSTDGGATWTALGTGSGSAKITNRTGSIVYDPTHATTWWESGIYNANGVYRTDDDGKTFAALGSINHDDLVSVDFTDPARKTLLAGGHEQEGRLNRSTDGGANWTDIGSKLPSGIGFSSLPYVIDGKTFLLGTTYSFTAGSQPGIFRSTDGGETWARVLSAGMTGAPAIASDGSILWGTVDNGGGVVRSTDGGKTWNALGSAGKVQGRAPILLPDGRLVALGADGALVITSDCGSTWHDVTTKAPFTPDNFTYSTFQKAFFIRHFDCNGVVLPDAIMRYDFDWTAK